MMSMRYGQQRRRGAVILLVTFCVLFLIIFSAFIINLAYMSLVDTQLRCASDAAARAGAEALLLGGDTDSARAAAKQVALANLVAGEGLVLLDEDIAFGFTDSSIEGRAVFEESSSTINSIRVNGGRREGVGSGSVGMLFRGILDESAFESTRIATAGLMDRDFCIVFDRSGSMGTRDAGRDSRGRRLTRMQALQYATETFVEVLEETVGKEQLGSASYSTSATKDRELSFDYDLVLDDVNDLYASGWTNIGDGIDHGAEVLGNTSTKRLIARPVLIVMTDGIHNRNRAPEDAAQDAMDSIPNLVIHTVTFSSRADVDRMESVAAIGKGRHHHAEDLEELKEVFADIALTAGVVLVE